MIYLVQEVSNDDGKDFAFKIGAKLQASSAKTSFGIDKLLKKMGKAALIPGYMRKDKKYALFSLTKYYSL